MLRGSTVLGLALCVAALCAAQGQPSAEQLLNDLACGSCHEGVSVETGILEKAPDLTEAGIRYAPDYVFNFLQYPVRIRQHIGLSRMPNFRLDQRESLALALYLQEMVPAGAEPPAYPVQPAFQAVKDEYPEVSAALGAEIFVSLNCRACHKHDEVPEWEVKSAPNLGFEGARARPDWLREFLRLATPVRPYGFYPGSGSRHPDFLLTAEEVEALAGYLMRQRSGFDYPALALNPVRDSLSTEWLGVLIQAADPDELIPFSVAKAEVLLRDKLPCLGCHRLGDDGGRIGPNLSSVSTRIQAPFTARIVREPASMLPEDVMPTVPMPQLTLDLLQSYLTQQDQARDKLRYFSLVDNPISLHVGKEGAEGLYLKHCAACHGVNGRADGYNSSFLPTPPTAHADSAHMSTRPDDTLFDGIYAGGYILNKSNRMPPWGFTLEREDIWQLVGYLRQLCQCEGPAWSRK